MRLKIIKNYKFLFTKIFIAMGSCGSSVADRAIGLDGHDAVKEYSIEKAKQ